LIPADTPNIASSRQTQNVQVQQMVVTMVRTDEIDRVVDALAYSADLLPGSDRLH